LKRHVFAFALAVATSTSLAASLDDADQRLFKAQETMAAKGDPAAQYYLGEMYENGLGTAMDMKQAFEQYEKSAAKGNSLAKYKLAHRKQIEEDATRVGTAEKLLHGQEARRAPEPPKPAAANKPAENPKAVTEAPKPKSEKELAAQAAAQEKLRAKLRAQLRERAKNPVGEPFE
jgi:TPR repeat protein